MALASSRRSITIYEFDALVEEGEGAPDTLAFEVPSAVFRWLYDQCLTQTDGKSVRWARLGQRAGRPTVQVMNFVGVIRGPGGFQIEVLPKIGRFGGNQEKRARCLLLQMLACLGGFQHIKTMRAEIGAAKMPMLEVFFAEFLASVDPIVKRGLRGAYVTLEDNLPYMRGKLLLNEHLRRNLVCADRFFTSHSNFSVDRPENRVIHSALKHVTEHSTYLENQKLARELRLAFAEVPVSMQIAGDLRKIQPERSSSHYTEALAWAELILAGYSPLTAAGKQSATSLMFPMEKLFEVYVAKHLRAQLHPSFRLKVQPASQYLVKHESEQWFRMEPDLVVHDTASNHLMVLDTKWKLLNATAAARKDKYQLSQADFYQLHAYGHTYLRGQGEVVLIYPRTDNFSEPLLPFDFANAEKLRLWVVPFCLETRRLVTPHNELEIWYPFEVGTGTA